MVNRKMQKIILIILIGIIFMQLRINKVEASSSFFSSGDGSEWSPFIWTIIIVGGSIVLTLSYVSWRKYKGTEEKDPERQND